MRATSRWVYIQNKPNIPMLHSTSRKSSKFKLQPLEGHCTEVPWNLQSLGKYQFHLGRYLLLPYFGGINMHQPFIEIYRNIWTGLAWMVLESGRKTITRPRHFMDLSLSLWYFSPSSGVGGSCGAGVSGSGGWSSSEIYSWSIPKEWAGE